MGDERESVSSSVFRTRAGESELFGKLKVGRASLGEEREGLEGCAIIINAAGVCRAQASEGHTSSPALHLGGGRVSGGQVRTERRRALAGSSAKTLPCTDRQHQIAASFGRARG